MKLLLDACVLYPTVMREMLIGAADIGCFDPFWSERILEEWARAAARFGAEQNDFARAEIALLKAKYPKSAVDYPPSLDSRLWLPDQNDIHVLAAAIAGSADAIVTLNARDFPRNTLAEEGLARQDPDGLLYGFWLENPEQIETVARHVLLTANRLSEDVWTIRGLLKKARMPRLAKALHMSLNMGE